jgi:L-ascorbate metabolism protein UlaG (beta-lactamase superfamily)
MCYNNLIHSFSNYGNILLASERSSTMKIKFLGHAAFLITSDTGIRIITDPYKPGCFDGGINYEPITEQADIVTISHEHDDHNSTSINGKPEFVRDPGKHTVKDVHVHGIETFHDTGGGAERGKNVVFKMIVDGMSVVHLGDLGHPLSDESVKSIGDVDVLFIPVGGYFTIDARTAGSIIGKLRPKVVIPMHFKTDKCGFPIAPVEDFTKGKDIKKIDGELEINKQNLPPQAMIYVLAPTK